MREAHPRSYLVSPGYDWLFFLGPPTLALALGAAISGTAFSDEDHLLWNGVEFTWAGLLIGIFIHAHLGIVFFRSHGNPEVFQRHRFRFLAVPVLLFAAMMSSLWVFVCVSVLATFWDVYHSALQTFGFGRLYDRAAGNDPEVGRRLDWWLNQLLYCGPILAGVSLIDHVEDFGEFAEIGTPSALLLTHVPTAVQGQQAILTWAVLGAGGLFLGWYVFSYWRLHRAGYRISAPKVFLFTSTGLCSIVTWGFNPWGEAFFIMNFFHALQYFGIVWIQERGNMARLFGVSRWQHGRWVALGLFLTLALLYGGAAELVDPDVGWFLGVTLVVSIMHFWYDGFIWSVRRNEV